MFGLYFGVYFGCMECSFWGRLCVESVCCGYFDYGGRKVR